MWMAVVPMGNGKPPFQYEKKNLLKNVKEIESAYHKDTYADTWAARATCEKEVLQW
jgi:hypothetical protein